MPATDGDPPSREAGTAYRRRLNRIYLWYTAGFLAFTLMLAVLEQMGMPRRWLGVTCSACCTDP